MVLALPVHLRKPARPAPLLLHATIAVLGVGAVLGVFAPIATAHAQPLDRYTTYKNMLGRSKTQSSVRITIKQLGDYTVEKLESADAEYYYSFAKRGVELHFDAKHQVSFAVLLNDKAFPSYARYSGSLPAKIAFADDEAAVIKKAGKAEKTKDIAAVKERVLFYDKKGFSVVLFADGPRKGKIKYIEIYAQK
ncbi:MAG: hypothetical protein NXI24_01975 [bacterium]|nr:hypothetical protein [bacterium]